MKSIANEADASSLGWNFHPRKVKDPWVLSQFFGALFFLEA